MLKKLPFYKNVWGPLFTTHTKRQKIISSTQVRGYNIQFFHSPELMKLTFAVLYVWWWTMGLTRCYTKEVFSGFDFDVCVVIGVSFYMCLPHFVEIGRWAAELLRHIQFSRWRPYSRKCTSGWSKTTSGFGKQTAAILEFYFWFRFRPTYSHRHAILHLPDKFHSNCMITRGVITSHPLFSTWRPAATCWIWSG